MLALHNIAIQYCFPLIFYHILSTNTTVLSNFYCIICNFNRKEASTSHFCYKTAYYPHYFAIV